MLFDIRIFEHWIDNPGNEAGGIKDIHLFADPYDYRDSYAYSLFVELVNEKDGLWKKKKFVESDGCWGEVIVKKSDLDYYFDEVHKRYFGDVYFPKFDKDEWNEISREKRDEFDFVSYLRK